ncbi:tetratricopeptide repeat protein [Flavobacterium sp. HTF]|uniref:tetratricopeptide repeat protein n=1 Tax=Flavobacterium sp. HTF TaxID=2170732 RepID=UPI000D5C3A93|nr:tetratricopeptide repeat protein [Flavobacterium sp. HTF]PWB23394.1 hypothetical protein DCO46_14655 [Flavobacterium sp. HTF]
MNVTDYTYLINKPDAITEKQTEALGNVLNEFPYFQSARALRLKGLHNQNSFKYNYALKVAAAHTADRSILFDFITAETYTAIQSDYYDQKIKQLLNITVFESEIVLPEISKVPEIRIDPIEQSILSSIREATTVVFEEQKKPEEKPVEPVFEEPVSEPVKEEKLLATEEPVKTEEINIDSFVEKTTDTPIEEIAPIVVEETANTEDISIDSFVEQPELTVVKEEEEPVVIEETGKNSEVRIDPIEESVFNSIKQATTVVFEKPEVEKPVTIEEPAEIEIQETVKSEESITIEEPTEIEVPENVKIAEEHLEIGKPLDFSINEKHSFQEWLQLSRTEPIDRSKDISEENNDAIPVTDTNIESVEKPVFQVKQEDTFEEKKKKAEIIDKFIETNPKISPIKPSGTAPMVQLDINTEDNSYLMTETLARVYLEQKKYTKAIQAYEILILKYPEKISFFADRISDIKILQQNNINN